MANEFPRIALSVRHEGCRSVAQWDEESLSLAVLLTFENGNMPQTPPLVQQIERNLGIRSRAYRVVLGDADLTVDSSRRFAGLDIRSNPIKWELRSLRPIPDNLPSVYLDLLARYDHDHIASYDVPTCLRKDPLRGELSISFNHHASDHWVRLADDLVVGVTADQRLSEFRLSLVNIVPIPGE